MKVNYQIKLKNTLKKLEGRPKLLLHSCCGPCSSHVISYLTEYFDITVYFYNPNIEPISEYKKRKEEQIRFIKEFKTENVLDYVDSFYENDIFRCKQKSIKGPEGGPRCTSCFELRLDETSRKANLLGYDYFGTTLTVSPHKNSSVVNAIGSLIESRYGGKFLYADFKKDEGYKKSIALAEEYELYRQDYCGCLRSLDEQKGRTKK